MCVVVSVYESVCVSVRVWERASVCVGEGMYERERERVRVRACLCELVFVFSSLKELK